MRKSLEGGNTMKQWERVIAFILTLLLTVYGLPVVPAAHAASTIAEGGALQSDTDEPMELSMPDSRMRLVQTGFDEDTGILTMTLQVKPDPIEHPSVEIIDGNIVNTTTTETVREGVFVFQTDAQRITPITNPSADPQPPYNTEERRNIRAYNRKIATVSSTGVTMPAAFQDFLAHDEKCQLISDTGSFERAMSSQNLFSRYTGYLVSGARADNESTGLLDCYVQFYFNDNYFPEPNEEGYVDVINLDFRCYGTGERLTAENVLFAGSIRVPENAQEAQEIVDQFRYTNSDGEDTAVAMGGAGFIQKYRDETYTVREGGAYYYFDEPVLSPWRKNGSSRVSWSSSPASPIMGEISPGLWYENMHSLYLVQNLSLRSANSMTGDMMPDPNNPGEEIPIPDSELDFKVPASASGAPLETGLYPRYSVPTYKQSLENEKQGNWIPESYLGEGKRPALKYYITTDVSSSSLSSPEHENVEQFVSDLKWEFLLGTTTSLVSLEEYDITEDEGEGKLIPTSYGEQYRVKEATLTDAAFTGTKLEGTKLWVVYKAPVPEDPSQDEYFMRTPVGVTLDMVESEVNYRDTFLEEPTILTRNDIPAPQLHVTYEAARPDSFIWKTSDAGPVLNGTKTLISLHAVYDPEGKELASNYLDIGLYQDTLVPKETDVRTEGTVSTVKNSAGESVEGFCVGNTALDGSGEEVIDDAVTGKKAKVRSSLYDQYHMPYTDRLTELELVPTEETQKAYDAAGKSCPFQVTYQSGDSYTIIYKAGTTVNDVVEGEHILRATYAQFNKPSITAKQTVYVSKPKDRLSYLRTTLNTSAQLLNTEEVERDGVPGTVLTVSYNVPARGTDNKLVTASEQVSIAEIANQWRDKNLTIEDPSQYDLVPGIRNASGSAIDLEKAREKGYRISYELSYPDGAVPQGLSLQNISSGRFTYNSYVLDGARFNLKITATYEGVSRFVEYQFQFVRQPRSLQQIGIYAPPNQTSYTITVPLRAVGSVEQMLDVVPIDQYGSQWDWIAVEEAYAPGGRLNQENIAYDPWSVYVDGELPEGVSLGGKGNLYVTVTTEAKTSQFKIYARFASCRSNTMTVNIVREPSKPTVMRDFYYNGNNIIVSPNKNSADAVVVPSVQVYDQYDELMTEYTTRWRYTVSPSSAAGYVTMDTTNGTLTVKSCAPDCSVSVTAIAAKNGTSRSLTIPVEIRRESPRPDSVDILETSVPFPSSADTDTVQRNLTAVGTTQYGEDQEFRTGDVSWRLEAVKFPDGTLYRTRKESSPDGSGTMIDQETGDIPFNPGTNTYSARGTVYLTAGGGLRFAATTLANNIPQEITVTAVCLNGVRTQKTITVTKEASVPDVLYFPQDKDEYVNGVQIPESGSTVTVPLIVYVRDQYGVVLDNAPIKWSYTTPLPKGVTVNTTAKTVTIDHTAAAGSIPITASCGTLQNTLYLALQQNEKLVPKSIDFTGYRKSSGATQPIPAGGEITLPLPAETGAGYETYTMAWVVRDQFTNPISKSVEWAVENISPGVLVQIYDKNSGMVRLRYSDEALQDMRAGRDVGFTLRVTAMEDSTVTNTIRVRLDLDDAKPAYAVPVMTDAGEGAIVESGVTKPVVPAKGQPAKEVTVEATVYDQYGREMPGEMADLKLTTVSSGLRFTQPPNTNRGTLYIDSTVPGLLVTMQAVPHGKPEDLRPESSQIIILSKGTAYAYELKLADANNYQFDIPYWGSTQTANAPDPDYADQLSLRAEVVDQYDAWMRSDSALYHPVWEFVGDHTGVEFAAVSDGDGDGIAEGEDIVLDITNRAVPAGQLTHTVTLRLHTSNQPEDKYFTKTVTLKLDREEPEDTYLYITGANAGGVQDPPLQRPYAKDKKLVYQFDPVVYDQYGAPVEDAEIEINMDKSVLEGQDGILVEETYKGGESEEKGNLPISYKIYRVVYRDEEDEKGVRTLLAEFNRLTGELTVYTACDCIEKLAFTAKYEPLGEVGYKTLSVPIVQEDLRPYSVQLTRTHRDFVMTGSKEPIEDYVYPTVYDQYGNVYTGGIAIQWNLVLPQKDESGHYLPYDSELDSEGNERPPSQFLVLKTDGSDNSTTVTVQPESFYTNKLVLLECLVIDTRYTMDPTRWVYEYAQVNVHRPYNTGVTVYFDAGEYGKLVGESAIPIVSGSAPENPPGVKTVEGYGFVGWTSDGVMVVDASKIAVFSDVTYTAVYKDITGTKFLEGYGDKTVRPNQNVTRAEFVSMVVRALGGFDANKNYGRSFADVPGNQWYSNTIAYAKQIKIVNGYPDGSFRPNRPITRAEAAKILAEATHLRATKWDTFRDVKSGTWYAGYVEALAEAGVVNGYPDGTFRPGRNISRAEAIKLIVMITKNALNELERTNIQKYAYCPFADIKKEHWAYAYILRAAGVA